MLQFQHNLLLSLILTLALGLVLAVLCGAWFSHRIRDQIVRVICLLFSSVSFVLGCFLWLAFDNFVSVQFVYTSAFFSAHHLPATFGVDGFSLAFLFLTLFIMPICFIAAWSITKEAARIFQYLLLIELLLVVTFTVADLFYFYVFFESVLIPMFILIGRWGSRARRIKAAYYFFLYTLFGSLFMLYGLFYIYTTTGSTKFLMLQELDLSLAQQKFAWACFFIGFAVKVPMFPFHIWLPEAHVEAPTVGSIILASLLLKLGGYGFLRLLTILPDAALYFSPYIQAFSLCGVVYGSLATIRQLDMKRVIAYSSVAHMNLAILGLFGFQFQAVQGSVYLMLAHGIVSSALFFIIGIIYERHHTRLLRYYGGLTSVMPLFSSFFLLFTLANMSLPGTCNFIGEFLIFMGLFATSPTALFIGATSIVLAAIYSLWLFNRVAFGTLKTRYMRKFEDVSLREFSICFLFAIMTVFFGFETGFITDVLEHPVRLLSAYFEFDEPNETLVDAFTGSSVLSTALVVTKTKNQAPTPKRVPTLREKFKAWWAEKDEESNEWLRKHPKVDIFLTVVLASLMVGTMYYIFTHDYTLEELINGRKK